MPLYEYVCNQCGTKFELLRSLSRINEITTCSHCGSVAERLLSTFISHSTDDMGFTKNLGGSSCAGCGATSCDTCNN